VGQEGDSRRTASDTDTKKEGETKERERCEGSSKGIERKSSTGGARLGNTNSQRLFMSDGV
jgi:hypothetical protein